MASRGITIHVLLGPRAAPSFLVRFGIWFLVAILAAVAFAGSLISYRDRTFLPVQFTEALPIRSEWCAGHIRFAVANGALIEKHQIIARLKPREPGVAVALVRIPPPFSATIKAGDLVACDIRDAGGLRVRMARVDSVLTSDREGIVVCVVVAGEPAKGVLKIAGQDHSVLYRLVMSLLKK